MTTASEHSSQSLSVSCATARDAGDVHALLEAAATRLAARGFPNWLPVYARELLEADIAAQIVHAVRDADGALVATFMLRTEPARPYAGIEWGQPDGTPRYLNRLAVAPKHQGFGIGRWCLARIAEQCAADGVTAVRCDVLQANVPLRRFYERYGYESRGNRFHSGWRFEVYERMIAAR